MKKNNKKGFTIVELVIVIAVIAILAAVLIPTFSNVISQANQSNALQETRNAWTDKMVTYDLTDMSGYDYKVVNGDYTFYITNGSFAGETSDSSETYKMAVIIDNEFFSEEEILAAAAKVSTQPTADTVYAVVANNTTIGYIKYTSEGETWAATTETSSSNKCTLTVTNSKLTATLS